VSLGSFIAGVAVGGATVLLVVYLTGTDSAPVEVVAEPAVTEPDPEPEIDITFFQALPEQQVKTGNEGVESTSPTADLVPYEYMVQAGSFPRRPDADKLRAQLMLEGMDVGIAASPQEGGGIRHRVLVGPFDNQADAQDTRSALRDRDIQATILSRPLAKKPFEAQP